MSIANKTSNINDSFFDGYYKEVWRAIIPNSLTEKEVNFIIDYFRLNESSKVLDLMCGYGRHSLALALNQIQVTSLDNSAAYIEELKVKASEANLDITVFCETVLDFNYPESYDLVICMGNSFNFFDPDDTRLLVKKIANALKTGGHFLIHSWSVAEIAIRDFAEASDAHVGAARLVTTAKYLLQPSRIESEITIVPEHGETEFRKAVDYIYSINEMESFFSEAGLELMEVYSVPPKKQFKIGDARAYFIIKKL